MTTYIANVNSIVSTLLVYVYRSSLLHIYSFSGVYYYKLEDIAKLLLAADANIDAQSADGSTALMRAIECSSLNFPY